MSSEWLGIAQFFSIIVGALGTPGVTYYLMKRMAQDAIAHIRENCNFCRSHLEEKISTIDHRINDIAERQIALRERLPIEYVRREEHFRCLNGKK